MLVSNQRIFIFGYYWRIRTILLKFVNLNPNGRVWIFPLRYLLTPRINFKLNFSTCLQHNFVLFLLLLQLNFLIRINCVQAGFLLAFHSTVSLKKHISSSFFSATSTWRWASNVSFLTVGDLFKVSFDLHDEENL